MQVFPIYRFDLTVTLIQEYRIPPTSIEDNRGMVVKPLDLSRVVEQRTRFRPDWHIHEDSGGFLPPLLSVRLLHFGHEFENPVDKFRFLPNQL